MTNCDDGTNFLIPPRITKRAPVDHCTRQRIFDQGVTTEFDLLYRCDGVVAKCDKHTVDKQVVHETSPIRTFTKVFHKERSAVQKEGNLVVICD